MISPRDRRVTALGNVIQLAYVPADVNAALKYWTEVMGAGPFYHMTNIENRIKGTRIRGEMVDVRYSLMLGYWGDMQIELIEQHNDTPSIYSNWRKAGLEGLHHVCIRVDDVDHALKTCVEAGGDIVQEVLLEGGGAFYADFGGGPGTLLEVIQPPPGQDEFFAMMREVARTWDGSDPLRPV